MGGESGYKQVFCTLNIFINRNMFLQCFRNLEGQKLLAEFYLIGVHMKCENKILKT